MKFNIDEIKLKEYETKLREEYRKFYEEMQKSGYSTKMREKPNATETDKKRWKELIQVMPDPEKASLEKMVIIGNWLMWSVYESFYMVGAGEEKKFKWENLTKLTYDKARREEEAPILFPLLSTIERSANFGKKIGQIIGKYSHHP